MAVTRRVRAVIVCRIMYSDLNHFNLGQDRAAVLREELQHKGAGWQAVAEEAGYSRGGRHRHCRDHELHPVRGLGGPPGRDDCRLCAGLGVLLVVVETKEELR